MRIFRRAKDASVYLKKRKYEGETIGFVPTMGYLHEGHLSLVRAARRENDLVVMSIFVNPAQFGPKEDYKKYPRNFKRDKKMARASGVDVIFSPSAKEMYPPGYRTYIGVKDITEKLCGKSRPGHFKGVATVVAKLFNIVHADTAYFGQKDAQQAVVIRRMAEDLNIDINIKVLPIVREPGGLAVSSRNVYLSQRQKRDALVLYESLNLAKVLMEEGICSASEIKRQMKNLIETKSSARIEYISICDTKDLREIKTVKKKALIAVAVWVGRTRLIDNIIAGGKNNVIY